MVDEDATSRPSVADVRRQYEDAIDEPDFRAAAEYAYALAVRLREIGLIDEACRFARECLRLTETLPSETVEDVTSARQSVGGVPLPEYFHDDVVRWRLAPLLEPA
jgi:hypothetical protein